MHNSMPPHLTTWVTFDNLSEFDQFHQRHKLPKLTQDETDNMNNLLSLKKLNSLFKNLSRETWGPGGFTGELYQTFKEKIIPILCNLQEILGETLPNSLYEAWHKPDKGITRKENTTNNPSWT